MLRLSFLAAAITLFTNSAVALSTPASLPAHPETVDSRVAPSPFAGMTVKDFLALTPKKYQELTGNKLNLSQKISLKIGQYKVKRAVKKGQVPDLMTLAPGIDGSDFSIGGLVLGLILGIIGVLIAYLIGDSSVIKWAWIGFAIWVGIVLLAVLL